MRLVLGALDRALRGRLRLDDEFIMMPELVEQRFAKQIIVVDKQDFSGARHCVLAFSLFQTCGP